LLPSEAVLFVCFFDRFGTREDLDTLGRGGFPEGVILEIFLFTKAALDSSMAVFTLSLSDKSDSMDRSLPAEAELRVCLDDLRGGAGMGFEVSDKGGFPEESRFSPTDIIFADSFRIAGPFSPISVPATSP